MRITLPQGVAWPVGDTMTTEEYLALVNGDSLPIPLADEPREQPEPPKAIALFNDFLTLGGYGPVEREYRFHPVRRWRFDWYLPGQTPPVAFEYDGLMRHGENQGHTSIGAVLRDVEQDQRGPGDGDSGVPRQRKDDPRRGGVRACPPGTGRTGVMDMNELQRTIGHWAAETFPHHTADSIFAHLQEEIGELEDAIDADDRDQIGENIADVLILVLTLGDYLSIAAGDAVAAKHAINLKRTWDYDRATGYHRHVETAAE